MCCSEMGLLLQLIGVGLNDKSYALIICLISFFIITITEKKKKLFTELLLGFLKCILYILLRRTTQQRLEILNAYTLMQILMYLSRGVYCVTLSSDGVFVPLTGRPKPHFTNLCQLVNKLTDLPYPCCPLKFLPNKTL